MTNVIDLDSQRGAGGQGDDPKPAWGPPDSDARAVYTVAEVARLLSLSLGVTYGLVREGEIPARKLGGRWVIPRRAFHEWLDACRHEALPAGADT